MKTSLVTGGVVKTANWVRKVGARESSKFENIEITEKFTTISGGQQTNNTKIIFLIR